MRTPPEPFQDFQYALARHLRDPAAPPPAGAPARALAVYRKLLFNNLESLLLPCFPVLRSVVGEDDWRALVHGFFAAHACQTPYFHEVPGEFVEYLAAGRGPQTGDPPFLAELAHYEWIELVLQVAPDADGPDVDPGGDLLNGRPALTTAHCLLEYAHPVHRIGPGFRPATPPEAPTRLLAFRDAGGRVRFSALNAVSARLLHLIGQEGQTGRAALTAIAAELRHPDPAVVIEGGLGVLRELREQGAVLGVHCRAG